MIPISIPAIATPLLAQHNSLFTSQYWNGAVAFNFGNNIDGFSAVSGTFSQGVISAWVLLDTNFNPVLGSNASYIKQVGNIGSMQVLFGQDSSGLSGFILFLFDPVQNTIISKIALPLTTNFTPNVSAHLVAGGWNHFICSFDAAQTVPGTNYNQSFFTTIRIQMACNRFVVDTLTDLSSASQISQYVPASSPPFNIPGVVQVDREELWTIGAPTDSTCFFAYCYMGIASSFFDLTASGNLDYFVTSQLNPVNLGPYGSSVPLECVFMHTGGAGNLFTQPDINKPSAPVWNPNTRYLKNDFVVFPSAPGNPNEWWRALVDNPLAQPGTDSSQWVQSNPPSSGFQFQYNAADGLLWGGTVSDSPTQPGTF